VFIFSDYFYFPLGLEHPKVFTPVFLPHDLCIFAIFKGFSEMARLQFCHGFRLLDSCHLSHSLHYLLLSQKTSDVTNVTFTHIFSETGNK
jgi:hypothetical protein